MRGVPQEMTGLVQRRKSGLVARLFALELKSRAFGTTEPQHNRSEMARARKHSNPCIIAILIPRIPLCSVRDAI